MENFGYNRLASADKEPVCNCNDEFKSGPCPVHHKDKPFTRSIVVTDENLIPSKYQKMEGLTFVCTHCNAPSIMDFFKFCANCGSQVSIQSRTLTEAINKHYGLGAQAEQQAASMNPKDPTKKY